MLLRVITACFCAGLLSACQSMTPPETLHRTDVVSSTDWHLQTSYPQHGVVYTYAHQVDDYWHSTWSIWSVVDFDQLTADFMRMRKLPHPMNGQQWAITGGGRKHLTPTDLMDIKSLAANVWLAPPNNHADDAVDTSTCDLFVFNGEAVFHQAGSACPDAALRAATQHIISQAVTYHQYFDIPPD